MRENVYLLANLCWNRRFCLFPSSWEKLYSLLLRVQDRYSITATLLFGRASTSSEALNTLAGPSRNPNNANEPTSEAHKPISLVEWAIGEK